MTICFASYSQTRLCISHLYSSKNVLATIQSALVFKKWVCHTGSEAFKRRLVHGVVFYNNFVPLLNNFIANVPKCKAP